jgi:hypothetical protein
MSKLAISNLVYLFLLSEQPADEEGNKAKTSVFGEGSRMKCVLLRES